jgi:UDP-N-acetylglucosamine 1-carboxyvinyltransferase
VKLRPFPGGLVAADLLSVRVGGADRERADGGCSAKVTSSHRKSAREPGNHNLAKCLCALGRLMRDCARYTLTIHGRIGLHGATYAVMADRIEAGSYACAAIITGRFHRA